MISLMRVTGNLFWLMLLLPGTRLPFQELRHVACYPARTRSGAAMAIPFSPIHQAGHAEMVWIKPGQFQMGSGSFADSKPVHPVKISGFWMDIHEVTNAQFEKFVTATGYVTVAERPLNPSDFPTVPAESLVPGSAVFSAPARRVALDNPLVWWKYVPGASWRHPAGPGDQIKPRDPVVQVCYEDALAFAHWCGKELPTEAEWEFAARAGKEQLRYYWGNTLKPGGKWMANIFQGNFPDHNSRADGFELLAPVKSFPPNAFGIFDMDGNVWEWCADLYQPGYRGTLAIDPRGPATSFDPDEPGVVKHVQRGGSFLCSDQYCNRYLAGSRGKGETSSASNNLGFRCVSRDPGLAAAPPND